MFCYNSKKKDNLRDQKESRTAKYIAKHWVLKKENKPRKNMRRTNIGLPAYSRQKK